MSKIVVIELGFEDDEDAEDFADGFQKHEDPASLPQNYDVIECRVENP